MEIPNVAVLLAALSMIGWKPSLHRLVEHVIFNDQGAEAGTILSERGVSEWTGMSRTIVYNGFAELVAQQVLVRFDGGGPRGHAYRVNLSPHEWLVPWLSETPPSMDDAPSREWSASQEIALSRIYRLICPEEGQKTRSVARPVGALTMTAARAGARLEDRRDGAAPLLSNSTSLTPSERGSEGVKLVAAITERSGNRVWGALRAEIVALACDTETEDRLVALVRKLPPTPSIRSYVTMCADALAAPPPAPRKPSERWRPPDDGPAAPPPWITLDLTYEAWVERGRPSCETVDGGVAP